MIEPTIRVPVVCPKCGREKLTEFPIDEVAYALKEVGADPRISSHNTTFQAFRGDLRNVGNLSGSCPKATPFFRRR
jgi:hypothetical protein